MDALRLFKVTGEIDIPHYRYTDPDSRELIKKTREDRSVFVVCHEEAIAKATGEYQLNYGGNNVANVRIERVAETVYVVEVNSHVH